MILEVLVVKVFRGPGAGVQGDTGVKGDTANTGSQGAREILVTLEVRVQLGCNWKSRQYWG